jgi:hypothetical protein
MLVDEVMARIEELPALSGRVRGVLDLSELIRAKALPAYSPAAFVVHTALSPRGEPGTGTGYYLQSLDELVAVLLVVRIAGDLDGSRIQPQLHALARQAAEHLAGWAPPGAEAQPADDFEGLGPIGVLVLRAGRLVSLAAGTGIYQLDFALHTQLRTIQ